jgi:hypothetical protein
VRDLRQGVEMKLALITASLAVLAGCSSADDPRSVSCPIESIRVECVSDSAAHVYAGALRDEIAQGVVVIVHHTEYRQEQLQPVLPRVQVAEGGIEARVACDGGSFVEFVRRAP